MTDMTAIWNTATQKYCEMIGPRGVLFVFLKQQIVTLTNSYNIYLLSFSDLYVPLITLKEIWINNAYKSFFFQHQQPGK